MSTIVMDFGCEIGGKRKLLYMTQYENDGRFFECSVLDVEFQPGKIKIDRFVLESMLDTLKHLANKEMLNGSESTE